MSRKTYFRVCPYCGCTLDPGEKCDCQERKERHEIIKEYYKEGDRVSSKVAGYCYGLAGADNKAGAGAIRTI